MVRKIQAGWFLRRTLRMIVTVVPRAKMTRYTLKASTFPGNISPVKAPILVCKKVSEEPHKKATAKQRG